jgi:glycosyltransferase involved in cell wall biosynthesis
VKTPQVSILIPVFNRKDYIAECIQSALDQTFSDFEIVIVDNASNDGTWEICRDYAATDSRLRIFRNEKNLGPVRNWLACVEKATGRHTKILWSDDLIHPKFLEKTLPYLDDPTVAFVYSSARLFSDEKINFSEETTRSTADAVLMETGVYDSNTYITGALLAGGLENNGFFPVSPGCAVFRTQDVRKNLLLQVPNRVNSDFSMHAIGNDLLLLLLTAYQYEKFGFVNEVLSYFRAHPNSITVAATDGKIPLHYGLAKGFFAEQYVTDHRLLRKLNSLLLISLIRHKAAKFGIRSLRDFYPTASSVAIDPVYFLRVVTHRISQMVSRYFGR